MREAIGADIRKHREAEAMRFKRNQVGEQLLAAHTFDVPETLVEDELGKSLNNYARYLASQGVNLETAEIDWRKIGEEFRPEAVKRVKRVADPRGHRQEGRHQRQRRRSRRRDPPRRPRAGPRVRRRQASPQARRRLRGAAASLAQDRALELVLRESKRVLIRGVQVVSGREYAEAQSSYLNLHADRMRQRRRQLKWC